MDKFTLFMFFKSLFLATILPVYVAKADGGGKADEEDDTPDKDEKDEKDESEDEDRGDKVEDEEDDTTDDDKSTKGKAKDKDETEEEDEADDKDGKGSKTVPHSRFNEVVMQRNYWAERYKELEASGGTTKKGAKEDDDEDEAPKFDFDKKEEEYLQAVSDGDVKLCKTLRKEIRAAERAEIEFETEKRLRAELDTKGTQITESQKVDQLVKQYEVDFPMLKKGNKDFNGDLVSEILDDYKERLAAGVAPSKAIEKSTRLILRSNGIDFDNPGKSSGKGGLSDEVRGKKKEDARTRNADASGRQAPKLGTGDKKGKGNVDADDIDVNNLTDEEFDALPAATKKKLRGD